LLLAFWESVGSLPGTSVVSSRHDLSWLPKGNQIRKMSGIHTSRNEDNHNVCHWVRPLSPHESSCSCTPWKH
jgi:hypothetical protein